MKILQINSVCDQGSTGKICVGIADAVRESDCGESRLLYFWGGKSEKGIRCSGLAYQKVQALLSRITGRYGFLASGNTRRVIREIERYQPDIVHLHNVHDHTVHIGMLLEYLNRRKIKTVWTFHDCWAFTGYCAHFIAAKCDKWKTQCHDCVLAKRYSWFADCSGRLQSEKKKQTAGMDLTIVTPSHWLEGLIKESFLQDFPVKVIPNGIDLDIFRPTPSDFRKKYGCEDQYLLLGVAFGWNDRKGLDVFIELARRLDSGYRIVMVGIDPETERLLPENIISIRRTHDQQELAQIYSAADLFVNPTREDTYPTVNMEAIACGTPVVTFRTGGSPEIPDEKTGLSVECDDIEGLIREIQRIRRDNPFSREACMARRPVFDRESRFSEYAQMYRDLFMR